MTESIITAKGQTTIPADIRQSIGGTPGTRLVWHAQEDGRLFVRGKKQNGGRCQRHRAIAKRQKAEA